MGNPLGAPVEASLSGEEKGERSEDKLDTQKDARETFSPSQGPVAPKVPLNRICASP